MKPLSKRVPVSAKVRKHLRGVSDARTVPEGKWESLKRAVANAAEKKGSGT